MSFVLGIVFGVFLTIFIIALINAGHGKLNDEAEAEIEVDENYVLDYDIIHVIDNDTCKTVFHCEVFDEPITLGDCEDMLPVTIRPITVIAENPLEGAVFRIGNHKDKGWEKVGTTEGYA